MFFLFSFSFIIINFIQNFSLSTLVEFENGNLSNKPDVTDKIQFDLQRYKFGNAKSHHNDILVCFFAHKFRFLYCVVLIWWDL